MQRGVTLHDGMSARRLRYRARVRERAHVDSCADVAYGALRTASGYPRRHEYAMPRRRRRPLPARRRPHAARPLCCCHARALPPVISATYYHITRAACARVV